MAKSKTYEEFVEKFKPKKTTDDCYTPDYIYDVIKDWAVKEYGIDESKIVRPFWPGGDYESFDYVEDCVVLGNPPFSIISKIAGFYEKRGIKYFLFAPGLMLSASRQGAHYICAGAGPTPLGSRSDSGNRCGHKRAQQKNKVPSAEVLISR